MVVDDKSPDFFWLKRNKFFITTPLDGFSFIYQSKRRYETVFWYIMIIIFVGFTVRNVYDSVVYHTQRPTITAVQLNNGLFENHTIPDFKVSIFSSVIDFYNDFFEHPQFCTADLAKLIETETSPSPLNFTTEPWNSKMLLQALGILESTTSVERNNTRANASSIDLKNIPDKISKFGLKYFGMADTNASSSSTIELYDWRKISGSNYYEIKFDVRVAEGTKSFSISPTTPLLHSLQEAQNQCTKAPSSFSHCSCLEAKSKQIFDSHDESEVQVKFYDAGNIKATSFQRMAIDLVPTGRIRSLKESCFPGDYAECEQKCLIEEYLNQCDCLPWLMWKTHMSSSMCKTQCKAHDAKEKCTAECQLNQLEPCDATLFRVQSISKTADERSDKIATISIELQPSTYVEVIHASSYRLSAFLGEIGGVINFWFDISCMALLHLIVYLLKQCKHVTEKDSKTGRTVRRILCKSKQQPNPPENSISPADLKTHVALIQQALETELHALRTEQERMTHELQVNYKRIQDSVQEQEKKINHILKRL